MDFRSPPFKATVKPAAGSIKLPVSNMPQAVTIFHRNRPVVAACREPVQISGGSGADPLAREIGLAKVKDRQREDIKRMMVLPENELPASRPPDQSTTRSAAVKGGGRDDDGSFAR